MQQTVRRFNTITLRPHPMQFVIDELILMVLCVCALGYGGAAGDRSTERMDVGWAMLVFLI